MKTYYTLREGIKNIQSRIVITHNDHNYVTIGRRSTKPHVLGRINRSGAILCRAKEAQMIIDQKEEISIWMKNLFGDFFKNLHIVSTNALDIPERQDKRDAYYKH